MASPEGGGGGGSSKCSVKSCNRPQVFRRTKCDLHLFKDKLVTWKRTIEHEYEFGPTLSDTLNSLKILHDSAQRLLQTLPVETAASYASLQRDYRSLLETFQTCVQSGAVNRRSVPPAALSTASRQPASLSVRLLR